MEHNNKDQKKKKKEPEAHTTADYNDMDRPNDTIGLPENVRVIFSEEHNPYDG
jgi:hypothetical protein